MERFVPTITTNRGDATTANADALVVPTYTGEPVASGLDAHFDGHLAPLLEAAEFTGKRGAVAAYPTFGALPARWLILTGLGERTSAGAEMLRRGYGVAVTRARDAGARTVAVAVPAGVDAEGVSAIVEGILLALYHFATYKSPLSDPGKEVASVELRSADAIPAGAVEHGQIVAAAVALARDMVNTISNDKTPPLIAAWAQRVARESGLPCEVLDEKALASGGYNAILAVGKGSAAPPRLIEMVYEPQGGATKTVALVGKTITFDSGGLDVKSPR